MKDEQAFQVKSLRVDHSCLRAFKLGSIVTYKWIGKQFVTNILESCKMSLRNMKAMISMLFCNTPNPVTSIKERKPLVKGVNSSSPTSRSGSRVGDLMTDSASRETDSASLVWVGKP